MHLEKIKLLLIGFFSIILIFNCGKKTKSLKNDIQLKQSKSIAIKKIKVKEFTNPKDGSVLVFIPGGKFKMGDENGNEDEKPQHEQTVKDFWLGKYEITFKQLRKFYKIHRRKKDTLYLDNKDFNADNQPAVSIRWITAKAYAKWAKLKMPTEAEWEYAAKGGQNLLYPTADGTISHNLANYWGTGKRDKWKEVTSPVGSFPPNPLGIYDLAGNVWEWTSSRYDVLFPETFGTFLSGPPKFT